MNIRQLWDSRRFNVPYYVTYFSLNLRPLLKMLAICEKEDLFENGAQLMSTFRHFHINIFTLVCISRKLKRENNINFDAPKYLTEKLAKIDEIFRLGIKKSLDVLKQLLLFKIYNKFCCINVLEFIENELKLGFFNTFQIYKKLECQHWYSATNKASNVIRVHKECGINIDESINLVNHCTLIQLSIDYLLIVRKFFDLSIKLSIILAQQMETLNIFKLELYSNAKGDHLYYTTDVDRLIKNLHVLFINKNLCCFQLNENFVNAHGSTLMLFSNYIINFKELVKYMHIALKKEVDCPFQINTIINSFLSTVNYKNVLPTNKMHLKQKVKPYPKITQHYNKKIKTFK